MVVFLRFGEFVTGGPHFPLTADALKKVLTGEGSTEIFVSFFHAVCSLSMLPPICFISYYHCCNDMIMLIKSHKMITIYCSILVSDQESPLNYQIPDKILKHYKSS